MAAICPSCETAVEDTAVFCDNCGAKLPGRGAPGMPPPVVASGFSGPGVCSACGHANVPGTLYCDNCGVQLAPISVTPPPPPTPIQIPSGPPGMASPPPPVMPGGIPPPVAYPSAGVVTGRLVVQASNAVIIFPPGKTEIIIGREDPMSNVFPEVDLTPHGGSDAGVSRRHAQLVMQGTQLYIEDLGSTNFTFLNKQKLQPGQRYQLNNGDEVRFGRLTTTYYAS